MRYVNLRINISKPNFSFKPHTINMKIAVAQFKAPLLMVKVLANTSCPLP